MKKKRCNFKKMKKSRKRRKRRKILR